MSSLNREKLILQWLDSIRADVEALYLVGDIFDYWFEYSEVIPKGFSRLIAKLRELRDADIPIFFFTGNHDMWMFSYFEKEMGIPIFREPIIKVFSGKKFFIGHGDGLGPGDHGYKMVKKIFANSFCQWLFARIHPNTGLKLMRFFSRKSRSQDREAKTFLGPDKEWLVLFANNHLKQENIDYFIFGHRHLPIDYTLADGKARYINLGDWISHFTYAVFDGKEMELKKFEPGNLVS